jgi:hypothetical protein
VVTRVNSQTFTAVAPPNLPIAPNQYSTQHFDILNNVLRLFFNRICTDINILGVPSSGTTAARPTKNLLVGQPYFDTTINRPIWWDGTNWINASGTVV